MSAAGLERDLDLAFALADAADEVTLGGFLTDVAVEWKQDLTPVTEVDRRAETVIRELLAEHRPSDAVHGEEHADTGAGSRRWVIDPIDGTKNYVRGVPVWASLISLSVDDRVEVAVVSAPALSRRWWAVRGEGAHMAWAGGAGGAGGAAALGSAREPRRLCVSRVAALDDASVSYSSLAGWTELGLEPGFLELLRSTWRQRALGDFWSYMLLAEGAVDIAAEPEVPLYDLAAVSLIVEEAGGQFTNIAGVPGPAGGSAVATNGLLQQRVLDTLAAAPH